MKRYLFAMKLNSVIFHTSRLSEIRTFYEQKLGLPTGTYVKENNAVPDYSDSYVNYHIDGSMLCFEAESGRTDFGTIILNVSDFLGYKARIEREGIKIIADNDHYFKIKDPEGRSLIIERTR